MNQLSRFVAILFIVLFLSCDTSETGNAGSESVSVAAARPNANWQDEVKVADIRILAFGNSHVQSGEPIEKLRLLLQHTYPDKKVAVQIRTGSFLANMEQNPSNQQLIRSYPWTHLILQAQKYSTSGKYHYPTTAAEKFANLALENGTTAILFPEWPERDRPEQGTRVQQLHESIADKTGAIVSPIGLTWMAYRDQNPEPTLYNADGNHSNSLGGWMTAAVLYCTIAQQSPESAMAVICPTTKGVEFEAMGRIAWGTFQEQEKLGMAIGK